MRIFVVCLSLIFANSSNAEWPQFRGVNSAGHCDTDNLPLEFGPGRNELWRTALDSGHSSPVVSRDAIFLTTFNKQAKQLNVVCIHRHNGTVRWTRPIVVDAIERGHPSFNPASSTPATDGERVVAYFGSFGLVCFDMEGKLLWERRMPLAESYAGNATSPAIIGDRVFLYRGNLVDHFMLALDKHTGEELWRIDQQEPFHVELACTACPIVSGNKLIMHTARSVQAFDVRTGEQLWVTKCATTATSTPVLAGQEVLVAAWNKMGEPALRPEFPDYSKLVEQHDKNDDRLIGRDEFPKLWIFHRPEGIEAPQNGAPLSFRSVDSNQNGTLEADEWERKLRDIAKFRSGYQQHGLLAIPIDSRGVLDADHVRTLARQGIPEVPSPIYHNGLVYLLKNGGLLTVIDVQEGKRIAKLRTEGKGTHYASPIIADNKLLTTAGNGKISVISLGRKPRLLRVNDMGDGTYATPAACDGVLYVRTHSHLYAFGNAH